MRPLDWREKRRGLKNACLDTADPCRLMALAAIPEELPPSHGRRTLALPQEPEWPALTCLEKQKHSLWRQRRFVD